MHVRYEDSLLISVSNVQALSFLIAVNIFML